MMKIKVSCGNRQERGDVTEILLALYGKGYQCKVKNPRQQGKYQRVYIEAYKDYEPKREEQGRETRRLRHPKKGTLC